MSRDSLLTLIAQKIALLRGNIWHELSKTDQDLCRSAADDIVKCCDDYFVRQPVNEFVRQYRAG